MKQPKKQDTDISAKCRVVTKISSYQVYAILLLGGELNGWKVPLVLFSFCFPWNHSGLMLKVTKWKSPATSP